MNLKKLITSGLVCGIFGMICAAENLIRNPEFELSSGRGQPKSWNVRKGVEASFHDGEDGKHMKLVCLPDGKTAPAPVQQYGDTGSLKVSGPAGCACFVQAQPIRRTFA